MSASRLIDAALCGVRHLRCVQSLIDTCSLDKSKEDGEFLWESEYGKAEFRNQIRVLPKGAVGAITQGEVARRLSAVLPYCLSRICICPLSGVLLVAHPLSSDIWRGSLVLITNVSKSFRRVEGVIINRKPFDSNSSATTSLGVSSDPVSEAFLDALRSLTSSVSKCACVCVSFHIFACVLLKIHFAFRPSI